MGTMVVVPNTREKHDQVRQTAIKNGCSPRWYDGICGWAWHCGCDDLTHACDSQCSMITLESAKNKLP
jgi:hypothetical protein